MSEGSGTLAEFNAFRGQMNELIRSLKKQKKQQRLMQTTLKSLKELQAA